jgi:hypothetical protein
MHHLRASTWIDAPPQRVWDLYADVEGSVAWVPFAEEILSVSGPAGLGQVYRERTRLGGISMSRSDRHRGIRRADRFSSRWARAWTRGS